MTLLQQFVISLSLPLPFLFLLLYFWQKPAPAEARYHRRYWLLGLLALLLWSSSVLSHYLGVPFPREAAFFWRAAARHMLSLFGLLLLLTTAFYLNIAARLRQLLAGLSLALWLAAVIFDPAFGLLTLPDTLFGRQALSAFNFWAGIWTAAWLVPVLAAWLLSWQAAKQTPRSLYRNRVNYWVLTVILFLAGGLLGVIQQPGQPLWQELSALLQILAASVGTITLVRTDLPDLRLTLRHLGARLASSLLIFALTWTALWYIASHTPRRESGSTSLDLLFLSAIFAGLFMAAHRLVPELIRPLFLPRSSRREESTLANEPDLGASLLHSETLATLTLRQVQAHLATEEATLFLAEEGPAGAVVLRPQAHLHEGNAHAPISLAGQSPLTEHLRRTPATPLFAYDVAHLDIFQAMPAPERESLGAWQYQLLLGLHGGQQLAGVLMLGDKYTGAPYTAADSAWLQELAGQVGPLLLQAQHLLSLERINRHLFDELQASSRESRYLQELSALYAQFSQLATPELRTPLTALSDGLQQLTEKEENSAVDTLEQQLTELRLMIDHLITTADRVQKQRVFVFDTMRLDEAIAQAVRNLSRMAEARRVSVTVDTDPRLPPIQGDEQRLTEAIQHLLHNAIKFNKIGGEVRIECAPAGNELYLHVRDTGVGIPAQRLEQIWTGFGHLHNGSRRHTSPGMGLLLARFIARAHGGRIEARSRHGAGSTFTIYLPLMLDR